MAGHEARATQLESLALEQWEKGCPHLAGLTMQQAQVHATLAVADEVREAATATRRAGSRDGIRDRRRD